MANEVLAGQVEAAAQAAGLRVVSVDAGQSIEGTPTERFKLATAGEAAPAAHKTLPLELSTALDIAQGPLAAGVATWMAETAQRLRNPRPDCAMTLHNLPLSFGRFEWPFHHSSSGADTSLVHGEVWLEDGVDRVLHAKVAVSMTLTFREVVAAPEQPFAENFIYNAVRKTTDQGQLELVKSGNRQPVPLTTRYYSSKQKKFIFNDTTAAQRYGFLASKLYWLSGALGGGEPVWLLDPRDAQYLDASLDDLREAAKSLATDGLLQTATDAAFGSATPKLMDRRDFYLEELARTLKFLKPDFNEEMRAGLTNM